MTSGDIDQDVEDTLCNLLQMGRVAKYQNEFEILINRVTRISESLLKTFYISGLKPPLQCALLRSNTTTLNEAFSLAHTTKARFTDLQLWELLRSNPTTLGEAFSLARFEDERSTTTIPKANDLNTGIHVQDLEETIRHKPNKVEVIKTSRVATFKEHEHQENQDNPNDISEEKYDVKQPIFADTFGNNGGDDSQTSGPETPVKEVWGEHNFAQPNAVTRSKVVCGLSKEFQEEDMVDALSRVVECCGCRKELLQEVLQLPRQLILNSRSYTNHLAYLSLSYDFYSPESFKDALATCQDVKEPTNGDSPENNPQYTTVYVGNLAPEVTQLELYRHFRSLGAGVIGECSWGSKPTPLGTSSNPLPPPANMDLAAAGASQAIYDGGFQSVAAAQQLIELFLLFGHVGKIEQWIDFSSFEIDTNLRGLILPRLRYANYIKPVSYFFLSTNISFVYNIGFWDMFYPEGYSHWFCTYKYNDENTVSFVTMKNVGGFHQSMDHARNYAFGKM
ncbi:class II heat shock protein [Tanacetum coccineum]